MTDNYYIGKSVEEQILDKTTSYLHCSLCGCKIDSTLNMQSSPEIIDGHIYCGTQNPYENGCKYKKKLIIKKRKVIAKKHTKQIGIRMDMETIGKLKVMAEAEGRNMSNMIRRLIYKQLRKIED